MLTRLATSTSAIVMLLCMEAGAAAPPLPPTAVGPQTTVVVYMDSATFTPDAMRQAARALLGPNSQSLPQINQQIAKYQEHYDKAIRAGVQSVFVVTSTSSGNQPGANAGPAGMHEQAVTFVNVKPGADHAAVERAIRDEMKPEDQDKNTFEHQGNFLVMHEKAQSLRATADAGRAMKFTEALNHTNNAAMLIAFVPDQAIRDQAKNQQNNANVPKWLQDAVPVLANSQWGTLAINMGQSPSIVVTAQTADAQSGKSLSDSINAALADLRKVAQNPNQGPMAGTPLAMFAPMIAQLADALRPQQDGTTVTVQLNQRALSVIAEPIANLAPILMGGNGAPGAAPRRGR